MTLREVTPNQAHQAVKGQNYKGASGGRCGHGQRVRRSFWLRTGQSGFARASLRCQLPSSCWSSVASGSFQARAAHFLSSNNYFYFFLTERDLNSNIEETKNVFPTACHRLLPSLPCLSPSLQPGWGKSLKLNKVPSSREVYLSWLMTHRYKEVEYYKWIFHQSTIISPSEESGPHHSLATLLYSVLMQVTDAILYDDHDVAALRRDLPWFCQLFTSGGGWRCRYIRSSLSSKPMWHCINIC